MRTAEQAVRARALALLAGDSELAGLVHAICDGTPPRITPPYVSIGGAESVDWGTKDREGREIRLAIVHVGTGRAPDDAAAARVEALVAALPGTTEGWTIVGVRIVRTRFVAARPEGATGGWRRELVVRCRCLAEA